MQKQYRFAFTAPLNCCIRTLEVRGVVCYEENGRDRGTVSCCGRCGGLRGCSACVRGRARPIVCSSSIISCWVWGLLRRAVRRRRSHVCVTSNARCCAMAVFLMCRTAGMCSSDQGTGRGSRVQNWKKKDAAGFTQGERRQNRVMGGAGQPATRL